MNLAVGLVSRRAIGAADLAGVGLARATTLLFVHPVTKSGNSDRHSKNQPRHTTLRNIITTSQPLSLIRSRRQTDRQRLCRPFRGKAAAYPQLGQDTSWVRIAGGATARTRTHSSEAGSGKFLLANVNSGYFI